MTDRPHSMLVQHEPVPDPQTWGEALNGRADGCLACAALAAAVPGMPQPTEEER